MTILIVEPDGNTSQHLKERFQKDGFKVEIAEDGETAFDKLLYFKPEIILLCLELADITGWDFLKTIKSLKSTSDIAVIVMTEKYQHTLHRVRALVDFLADDYLIKPIDYNILLARVKAILRRKEWSRQVQPEMPKKKLRYGHLIVDIEKRTLKIGKKFIVLRKKEFDLLSILLSKIGRAFSREELLENINCKTKLGKKSRVIDKHIASLKKKLKLYGRRIVCVSGYGYKFSDK